MRGYTWVPRFTALALKKTDLVSRNFGHLKKSTILPLCWPCIQFCFLYLIFVSTEYISVFISNFQRIYNMKNWKKINVNIGKNICVSFAIMQKKKKSCHYLLSKLARSL